VRIMTASSDRWRRLERLFHEAAALEPGARAAFLEKCCGEDITLREEVESLLASADRPMDFVDRSIQEAAQNVVESRCHSILHPGTRFSRYEVIASAGSGGMGQVYLARDTQLQRNVALKLLAPQLTRDQRVVRRFAQEAKAASALNHPNILTLYDFAEVEGVYYIASEYVEGETLRQRIHKGKLGVADVADISIQVMSALVAAHDRGIVHRDIKPANLMVRNDGIVKLLDFGIAKLSDEAGSRRGVDTVLSVSDAGTVMGTVRYMSPEQARGQAVDGRTDLFSVGVVMYEMLTGQPPFQGETTNDVIAEILKSEPVALTTAVPGLSPQLERIVQRAIRKNREERYSSAAEILHDLHEFRKQTEFQQMLKQSTRPALKQGAAISVGKSAPNQGSAPVPVETEWRKWLRPVGALLLAVLTTAVALRYRWHQHTADTAKNASRELAVLPFRNLRPDPQTDFLGFSLADAIITKLGYVNALTVRPSSAVERYRNQAVDPQNAAADLQVGTLLTGGYVRDGDQLRITAQLIDVKANRILWRDTIDLKYDRLLTVQDTVSHEIIAGLELSLTPAEKEKLRPETTVNPEAYEYYLRGVDLYASDDFPGAIRMLEKAATTDPSYAPSWAHLGRAYTTNASLEFGGRDQYAKAQAAYQKAIDLNPSLAEARVFMANLLTDTGRVEQAVPLMRTLLAENPGNAEAHWELGYAYRFGGMLQEALTESERARQNNPSVKLNSAAMNAYLYLGQYEKFLQSLPANDSVYVVFYRGFAQYHLKRYGQAAQDFDHAYWLNPTVLPANVGKALSYDIHGERKKALDLLRATEKRILDTGVTDAESLYKVAEAYTLLGDKSSALLMFHRTIEGGFFPYPYFERDPLLDNIRKEPEFEVLMQEAQERYKQFKAKFF
jgi:serine/threonine protein kinase/TolB-like protein/Flp pilus assembly protein TadD